MPGHNMQSADGHQAYCQSEFKGSKDTWFMLPPPQWPAESTTGAKEEKRDVATADGAVIHLEQLRARVGTSSDPKTKEALSHLEEIFANQANGPKHTPDAGAASVVPAAEMVAATERGASPIAEERRDEDADMDDALADLAGVADLPPDAVAKVKRLQEKESKRKAGGVRQAGLKTK